jgi:ribosomal protein L11 methyltransferase
VRRIALRVEAGAVEEVLDELLPRVFDGVHVGSEEDGAVELIAYALTTPLPDARVLGAAAGAALLGLDEGDAPDDWRERRRRAGRGVGIEGRIWLRSELDPPGPPGHLEVVIERGVAFGTGAHPTTRMCLALLLGVAPRGSFADLGCGAGALTIAAAKLGFAPVEGVDNFAESVEVATANVRSNGVDARVRELDVTASALPEAAVVAANMPADVHPAIAERLGDETRVVIASGIGPVHRAAVVAAYERRGLRVAEERAESNWLALRLERRDD